MSRFHVPSRSRVWSRVAVFALAGTVGMTLAGCSDSARFDSNPFASNGRQAQPEVTGSIAPQPQPARHVVAQPLPAPSRPVTIAAARPGTSDGARGLGAYRPETQHADITGSVTGRRAPAPTGHWTWDGGKAVRVDRGETLEGIARRYGVPASAILQVNHLTSASAVRPGQRLIIPRYVSASAPHRTASAAPAAPRGGAETHVVKPGETLIGIARRHGMSLSALARANHLKTFTKLNVGDRVTIPSGHPMVAARHETVPPRAPKVAEPRSVRSDVVASIPAQKARLAKAEVEKPEPHEAANVTRKAEPAGGIPTFRWPVRGRIIAGFGPRPNGTQNDGINLAVPAGTPIKAADDGVVAYAGNELKGYGNLVLIRHSNGFVSAYANASELLVKRGEHVKRGQVIARAGQTGNVTSPQLHFEIRKGSVPVDPTKYLGGA
jgi:murein DD-endopeptidase MepM/ murein hydrolase activator NlpD